VNRFRPAAGRALAGEGERRQTETDTHLLPHATDVNSSIKREAKKNTTYAVYRYSVVLSGVPLLRPSKFVPPFFAMIFHYIFLLALFADIQFTSGFVSTAFGLTNLVRQCMRSRIALCCRLPCRGWNLSNDFLFSGKT